MLHIDQHLAAFVAEHGPWVYALLFAIVFVETGLVVMPFLPGDSLLFATGTLCGLGAMDLALALPVLLTAAVAGDQLNYTLGRRLGPRVWSWPHSRFFNRKAFERAHAFYEQHGGITVVLARFMPFVRTFAPFVAGVSAMGHRAFTAYNLLGAALWVGGLLTAGRLLGGLPFVQQHLSAIVWGLVLLPAVGVVAGSVRGRASRAG